MSSYYEDKCTQLGQALTAILPNPEAVTSHIWNASDLDKAKLCLALLESLTIKSLSENHYICETKKDISDLIILLEG